MVVVERLLAAIAETERKALAVSDHLRIESWTHPGPWVMHGVESRTVDEVAHVLMTGRQAEAIAEHIARNDPAAVLRRCAADRDLVEKYREIAAESDRVIERGYAEPDEMVSERLAFEWVIKNRAASYGISTEEETG